jgi:hypothetical protein
MLRTAPLVRNYQDLGGDYFVRRDTDRQRQRAVAQL